MPAAPYSSRFQFSDEMGTAKSVCMGVSLFDVNAKRIRVEVLEAGGGAFVHATVSNRPSVCTFDARAMLRQAAS